MALRTSDGRTVVSNDPADKSRTMDAIKKHAGARAVALAKKGRADAEKLGRANISDELHCLLAIAYALANRRAVMLLTADRDYLEVFYKAQRLIDTHYRAWLAARLIRAGEYGTPAGVMADTHSYFRGPLTLYRRPTGQLEEVLPPYQSSVPVGVVYVAQDEMIHTMTFSFEPLMLDMLRTRGATDGRCTDQFGGQNVHVCLGPLTAELDGLFLGVGEDVMTEFRCGDYRANLSRLDLEQSLNCRERFVILR